MKWFGKNFEVVVPMSQFLHLKWDNASFLGPCGFTEIIQVIQIVSDIKQTLHKQKLLLLSLIFNCMKSILAYMWQNKPKSLMTHVEKSVQTVNKTPAMRCKIRCHEDQSTCQVSRGPVCSHDQSGDVFFSFFSPAQSSGGF